MILSYYVLLPLAGLHVAAALYHRFVQRDGVLARMLPSGWA
jgi:cytochrome b561